MAEFNQEQAIARYTHVMKLIHMGAYQERNADGSYALDGIERDADSLIYEAAQHGLEFHYHKEENRYSLEPMSAENKVVFLHVNILHVNMENLLSLLSETAQYLLSTPSESALDKSYRTELHERIVEALKQSSRIPVMREESEEEEDE